MHIGTSGWQHENWGGRFYPEDLPKDEWLSFYVDTFDTVEVNNTFYQRPDEDTLRTWRRRTPDRFLFSVKASQYITHFKKLKDPAEPLQNLYRSLEPLGDRLGPILFQCPPNWHQNLDRLRRFLGHLSDEYRHVFEFRDPTWLNEGTYEALANHDAAFCIYEFGEQSTYRQVTTDWVYVRLHGRGEAYYGRYTEDAITEWADQVAAWEADGREVFLYFNNAAGDGHAPHDARRLLKRIAARQS